jgi:large subunit ribosomal protein L24
MKIRKGDQIQIISGKDRGKRGKVVRTIPAAEKIVIEGLNLVKRHKRPKKGGEKGQRIEVPAPVEISNVLIVCPNCGKPARVGYKISKETKTRICKKCQGEIKSV